MDISRPASAMSASSGGGIFCCWGVHLGYPLSTTSHFGPSPPLPTEPLHNPNPSRDNTQCTRIVHLACDSSIAYSGRFSPSLGGRLSTAVRYGKAADGIGMDRDTFKMEGTGAATSQPVHQAQALVQAPDSSKSSSKRMPKDVKSKPNPSSTGTRFQCPRCPKNFTRIENLTRHQANHEDVGKFACVICKKRFTRSDLLNRHRRIHGSEALASSSSSSSSKSHVTPLGDYSDLDASHPEGFGNLVHRDGRRSASHEGANGPSMPYSTHVPHQHQALYPDQSSEAYHQMMPHGVVPQYEPSVIHDQSGRVQGLTSLMEAALAPQDSFPFTPVENLNPSMWDGFMLFDNTSNPYLGSFDADISWTLNQFQPESSPDYAVEYAMMGAEYSDPYQQVVPQYLAPEINQIDVADAVNDDTSDWPEKTSRPGTPSQHDPRIAPVHLLPMSWQPVIDEARASGLSANTIRPYQQISDQLRAVLFNALNGSHYPRNELSRPEIGDGMFPPSEVLDFFLRLYIKYLQPRFPVLHMPTFDLYTAPPLLLIAMIFMGSSHSKVDQGRLSRVYHPHLRTASLRMHESDITYLRLPENTLTFCLLCLAGTWSGSKQGYAFAEAARGIMVTACRRGRLLDCRSSSKIPAERYFRPGVSKIQATWLAWIETEKRKRLGLSIYIYDSQYPALFNNQPYVSKAETTNCIFPCPEEYWEAPTAEQWKMLVGPADMPPSTYFLHALNSCLLRKKASPPPPIPRADEFGKIVLMYAILTQIFEWRQSTSMLNPTGLMGTFGNTATHELSEDLKQRRRCLLDCLDSWRECYRTPSTSPAALLLHRLAYISLDVSLSDMHLAAGRSVNRHDGNFAEENLKYWANSDVSEYTMMHVFHMLEISHQVIAIRAQGDCSYEVAVCLFTGGIVCWAYAKLRRNCLREQYLEQVRRASKALQTMGCWRTCSLYGRILNAFDTS